MVSCAIRFGQEIRRVRTIWRQRCWLAEEAGRTVQQMQKALTSIDHQRQSGPREARAAAVENEVSGESEGRTDEG